MPRTFAVLVVSLIALIGKPADAQFFYSSPPPLMGQPSHHVYSVPGVNSAGGLGTFFACSNTTDATIRVGVEVFGFAGGAALNDPSATSLDVAPGGSVIFGTGAAAGISISSNIGAGLISKGLARILATEKKGIICSAYLADTGNAPPTSMADLKVVAKAKQRGD